ncbi:hypothetical protein [Paenibacillus sp. MER 180]|nr:hypothetical protein [Paenibacillus sp. MER 180]
MYLAIVVVFVILAITAILAIRDICIAKYDRDKKAIRAISKK